MQDSIWQVYHAGSLKSVAISCADNLVNWPTLTVDIRKSERCYFELSRNHYQKGKELPGLTYLPP